MCVCVCLWSVFATKDGALATGTESVLSRGFLVTRTVAFLRQSPGVKCAEQT